MQSGSCVVAVKGRCRLRVTLEVAFEWTEQLANGHRGKLAAKLGIKASSFAPLQCRKRKVSPPCLGEMGTQASARIVVVMKTDLSKVKPTNPKPQQPILISNCIHYPK